MDAYRIVIADDHAMVRHGIRRIIEERKELKVVDEASDGLELLNILKKIQPDMIILDISMPHLRGLEAAREIKSLYPHIKILMLTMHKNEAYLRQTLAMGCDGYLLKEDAGDQLIQAIETIKGNQIFVSGHFANEVICGNRLIKPSLRAPNCGGLTSRQSQILKLVAEGKSNKEIAELLCVSVRTVEHHRLSVTQKLKLNNIINLMRYAIREGYVTVEPTEPNPHFFVLEGFRGMEPGKTEAN